MNICSRSGKSPKCDYRKNAFENGTTIVECVANHAECIYKQKTADVISNLQTLENRGN